MKFQHNRTTSRHSRREGGVDPRKPIIPGLGLIAIGVILLLHNLGTIDASAVIPYWPVCLIVLGITYFFGRHRREGSIGGVLSSRRAIE
jgi:hypothetical protein